MEERKRAVLLRAGEIAQGYRWFSQRLNPNSRFRRASLAGLAGLERTGLSLARLPPGHDSFAYHAHRYEEEWVYILSGRARATVDGDSIELEAGDFLAFPTPSVAHNLTNPYGDEVVYLMGGENRELEVIDYPSLGKRFLIRVESGRAAFYELADPIHPARPLDED